MAAPAEPIAVVATGTPPGICTIDNSESIPFNVRVLTGTPMTGKVVFAATIPGKWAAPPAPAIITFNPFVRDSSAKRNIKSGVLCADITRFS